MLLSPSLHVPVRVIHDQRHQWLIVVFIVIDSQWLIYWTVIFCLLLFTLFIYSAFCCQYVSINSVFTVQCSITADKWQSLHIKIRTWEKIRLLRWRSHDHCWQCSLPTLSSMLTILPVNIFTAQCTLVQSAVLRSYVVRLSVCDIGGLWSHKLEILETNCTDS